MFSDRVVVRSTTDNHVLFKVFKALYSDDVRGEQPYYDHHHSELEVSIILNGDGKYYCSGNEYEFGPGEVFLHCGNDVHHFERIDSSIEMIVIQFESRLIWTPGSEWFDARYLQLFMENSTVNRNIPANTDTAASIKQLLIDCFDECMNQKPAYEVAVKAKLLAILALIARYYSDSIQNDTMQLNVRHIEHIERSLNYIHAHLDSELTLEELAKEARMSRSYYSTMFKTLNGISVWNYITNQRIDLAQQLLETTGNSITEISQSCGFNNIANFNRAFKKITGKTPREYRNSSNMAK